MSHLPETDTLFFGASEETMPYAYDYMFVILLGNIITHLYLGLNSVLRASGHPNEAMIATIMTVVTNIFLDWLFIYPWGLVSKVQPLLL